jgi:RNA polymerase sigma factor (sigma-70 family)
VSGAFRSSLRHGRQNGDGRASNRAVSVTLEHLVAACESVPESGSDAVPAVAPLASPEALLAHEPRIRRLVHRLLGWASARDVDDVVQDVFLAAWRYRRTFRGDATFATWLHRIAVRKVQSHARWRAVRVRWFGGRAAAEPDASAAPEAACPVEQADEVRAVRAAMAGLPHRDREVLVLRYLEARPVEDVARLLGLRRAAVDARLSRARTKLRAALGRGDER